MKISKFEYKENIIPEINLVVGDWICIIFNLKLLSDSKIIHKKYLKGLKSYDIIDIRPSMSIGKDKSKSYSERIINTINEGVKNKKKYILMGPVMSKDRYIWK